MPEPVKYLDIVSDMLEFYQKELIKMFRKCDYLLIQILQKHYPHSRHSSKSTLKNSRKYKLRNQFTIVKSAKYAIRCTTFCRLQRVLRKPVIPIDISSGLI